MVKLPIERTKGKQVDPKMERTIRRMYLKASEFSKHLCRGQTMTEYALILAAVAIVVWVTYELMGQDVSVLVNNVDTLLTTS
jgi:Flp pilus assembly pilin Flp